MIVRTQALVLRVALYSETSQVVTWLTPGLGKLVTLVKGALRRGSPFQGQYDQFYTSELVYYESRHSEMHVAGECAALKNRPHLRRDWRAAARASYLACLANAWLPPHSAQPELFALLDGALDRLAEDFVDDSLVYWFELRLLEMAGMTPRLSGCLGCRQPSSNRVNWVFSPERGGLLCAGCRANVAAERPVMPDVLGLLGFWQKAGAWDIARRARSRPAQRQSAGELLGAFLRRHMDGTEGAARAREIMLEITA